MLYGDFDAGTDDDPWQVIPTAWVDAAMKRWKPYEELTDKLPMDSLGVDVARGGRDETIIMPRHGYWFGECVVYPGTETPDGPTTAGLIIQNRRNQCPVHIDSVGWGASPLDFLTSNGVHVVGLNGASKALGFTKNGTKLAFRNRRSELWWRMREALDPENGMYISLPNDSRLRADLTMPKWELTPTGIAVQSKEKLIKDLGRSPDRGDAACYALVSTKPRDMKRGPKRVTGGSNGGWMGA